MSLPARILLIGQDPDTVDYSVAALSSFDAEKVKAGLAEGARRFAEAGIEVDHVLTDAGATAAQRVAEALAKHRYEVVIIGAGIRMQPSTTGLLETVLNTIVFHQPQARIGFNTSPVDSLEAVQRVVAAS